MLFLLPYDSCVIGEAAKASQRALEVADFEFSRGRQTERRGILQFQLLRCSGVQKLHGAQFQDRAVAAKGRNGMPDILLAEDHPADVYLIRAALEEYGIDLPIQVAAEGEEVLRIISQQEALGGAQPKLIILDLNLPRHDGIEILQRLRGTKRLARIPVVVLTSSDSPRDRMVASELGATRFLRKPSNLEQFLSLGAVFKELLAQGEAQSSGG
jgi:CheY-like chemotaxis protein